MHRLIPGYKKFLREELPRREQTFRKLAEGQDPFALLITCSDSRIEPYLLTGLDPGNLFVIRNAGNAVPPPGEGNVGGEIPTIEYAVKALSVDHLIVCGHSGCGAVGAALQPDTAAGLPEVQRWVKLLGIEPASSAEEAKERLDGAIQDNVRRQLATLRGIDFVAEAIESDGLQLHGWVYGIGDGQILTCDAQGGEFRPLLEVYGD